MAEEGEWTRKARPLSDETAAKDYGVSQDFIVKGINAGKLEYREGVVLPHVRRVIEMPRAVNSNVPVMGPPRSAPVVGIRIEAPPKSKVRRLLVAVAAAIVLLCVAVVILVQSVVLPHKHAVAKKR